MCALGPFAHPGPQAGHKRQPKPLLIKKPLSIKLSL
jgi:hypothetical protein